LATPSTTTNPVKRNISEDYKKGSPALRQFYQHDLQNLDFAAIRNAKLFPDERRKVLVEVLEEHYARLPEIAQVRENLLKLALPETHSLTTGHQLNIMGGPLYTPFKVLSIAKLAKFLSDKDPLHPVVPVFWIHTEDHDFEEINHYFADFGIKKQYTGSFHSATGHHILEESITSLIPDRFGELGQHYAPGKRLAEATLRFAHELYGPYGVIVLDADHPKLKALFAPVLEKELFENFSEKEVIHQSEKLEAAGYPLQVSPREINLFWLDEQGRNRIENIAGGFGIDGRSGVIEPDEMRKIVADHPERFSPNVILRPLYQEYILPNLAYTGGWGELSYWMQLKGVFDAAETPFPLLLPRYSATVFTQQQAAEWETLGFSLEEISEQEHKLFRKYMPNIWDQSEFDELTEQALVAFDKLIEYASEHSDTLPRTVRGQQVKVSRFFKNLEKKFHRVKRHSLPKPFDEIRRLKRAVNPDHSVQERILGLTSFSMIKPEEFVRQIYAHIDVEADFERQYIVLDID
jgi:bacillithiol biosynthesis cysteine-adding enzyme BshC